VIVGAEAEEVLIVGQGHSFIDFGAFVTEAGVDDSLFFHYKQISFGIVEGEFEGLFSDFDEELTSTDGIDLALQVRVELFGGFVWYARPIVGCDRVRAVLVQVQVIGREVF